MDQLITITATDMSGETVQTVNARDLHGFLEVGKDFSNWIKAQIERARLVEGRDYLTYEDVAQLPSGAKHRKEYALTLDAGKHVAMMSNTDKGFEVREYFIECERVAKAATQPVPAVSRFLLRVENGVPTAVEPYRGEAAMMADLTGVVAALAQQVAEMKSVRYEPPAAAQQAPLSRMVVMTLEDAADILYEVIKAHGLAGIQANHLTRKSQMLRQDTRDKALRLLVNQGRVIRQDFGTSSVGGRSGVTYRAA